MLEKCHRDLKSPNILLSYAERSERLIAKIGDFGLARSTPSNDQDNDGETNGDVATKAEAGGENDRRHTLMTTFAGSLLWMAPEVFPKRGEKMSRYDLKVDVYSFGIILWETLELSQPWTHGGKRFQKGPIKTKIMNAVESGERPPISEKNASSAPTGYVELMRRCWQTDATKRPAFWDNILPALQNMEILQSPTQKDVEKPHGVRIEMTKL